LHYKPTMILPTWRFQEQNYFDLFQEVWIMSINHHLLWWRHNCYGNRSSILH
jgi:hypothetical protein